MTHYSAKWVEVQAELDPSADVYVYLGTLKSKSGDNKGAIADFNKAGGIGNGFLQKIQYSIQNCDYRKKE